MKSKEQFCENVRLCKNAMYSLAYSILKNDCDAADAISETILKAFSNIDSLNNDRFFKTWILKILRNTCIEMIRKNHTTCDIDEQYDIADTLQSDISASITLKDAVYSLKDPYRTVIILYYYEDLSVKEISKITESSVHAVKKQLSRAREMLRKNLNKEDFLD